MTTSSRPSLTEAAGASCMPPPYMPELATATFQPRVSKALPSTVPVKVAACTITLRSAVGQVPHMLQVTSYADVRTESFPSIYLRAVVPDDKLKSLSGQPLAATCRAARWRLTARRL